jgi:hypothetical protein
MDLTGQQHIINRISMQVRSSARQDAMQLQEQLGFLLHSQQFMSQLESLLDRLAPPGVYVEIPSLRIELDTYPGQPFIPLLLEQLESALRERLVNVSSVAGGQVNLRGQALMEAIRDFFLVNGTQLYTNAQVTVAEIRTQLLSLPSRADPELEKTLLLIGKKAPILWKRLFFLLGRRLMQQLVLRLFGLSMEELIRLIAGPDVVAGAAPLPVLDGDAWQLLLTLLQAGTASSEIAVAIQSSMEGHSGASSEELVVRPLRRQVSPAARVYERELGLPVVHAGVVLVWMGYGALLKELGWVKEKRFVDDAACQRAIWLLQYIASGRNEAVEEELLLNKLLCGWPLADPVDPACFPGQESLLAADVMLEKWIKDWKKDRTFSLSWFRGTFLQREGTLIRRHDENWQLNVEKKTEDIIIDKPSVVRYSWMPELLFVQW